MSLFEFSFALTSVILALALTNIVASFHRLVLLGRRVRWAPEPVLLTVLVVLVVVQVWLDQWGQRDMAAVTIGGSLLQVAKMMTLYFAAASCLPEPDLIPPEGVDIGENYYRTRALAYGAMIVGMLLFMVDRLVQGARPGVADLMLFLFRYPAIYLILILVRARWVHIVLLTGALLLYGSGILGRTLSASG